MMIHTLLTLSALGLLLTIALLFTQGSSFWLRAATVAVYLAAFVVALIAFNSNRVIIKAPTTSASLSSAPSGNFLQPKVWVSMILVTTLVMLTAVHIKPIRWSAMFLALLLAMGSFGWVTLSAQQVRGRSISPSVAHRLSRTKSVRYVTPDGKTIRWVRPEQLQALKQNPSSPQLLEIGPNFFGIPTDS